MGPRPWGSPQPEPGEHLWPGSCGQGGARVEASPVKVQSLLGHSSEANGKQLLPGLPDPGQQGGQLLWTHDTECPETLKPGHLADQEWRVRLRGPHQRRGRRSQGGPLPPCSWPLPFPKPASLPINDADFLNRTPPMLTEGPHYLPFSRMEVLESIPRNRLGFSS